MNIIPGSRVEVGFMFGGDNGKFVYLLTPTALNELPDGTAVINCLWGEIKIKGKDYLDNDTRAGFTVWGIPEEEFA